MDIKRPEWLKTRYSYDPNVVKVIRILDDNSINTVCREANCPNVIDCFSRKTATFMILGRNCTRNCRFCNVTSSRPEEIDKYEPEKIADAVLKMKLKYVVITSVTRDDLDDGGAGHFASVVRTIKDLGRDIKVELLIPDLKGDVDALKVVLDSRPDVLGHNVETAKRLYREVRSEAEYERSLEVLSNAKKIDQNITTKSGMMLGLGETVDEVIRVMKDLRKHDCDIMTLGQYLSPSPDHYPVKEYIRPEAFGGYEEYGKRLGFSNVFSGPLVRSSFHADEVFCKGSH
ncbi:lipoic acid synthetase [Dethiosulfatibacter aminovorans DSM 17477]|uniref:Lipoyl synthase n=1 Tax=Dethiosulfatibacter aminovorans DSM 17477 TaxID=1121476 RepID=A0A1M6ANS9_9FIRM|nr:lipoyl synthase [Dethiosulfatibacter aminovorans]SHI38164.1 lipoic acid synthetase [Dethiosulfatibacter aminovorans DSM 17477]